MGALNWIDLGIMIIFAYHLFKGYRTGLARQLFGIIGVLVAIYMSFKYFEEFGRILRGFLGISAEISEVIGFGLILLVVTGALGFIGIGLSHILGALFLGQFDRLGGAGVGMLKGVVLIYILLLILGGIPLEGVHRELEGSDLAVHLLDFAPRLYRSFKNILPLELPEMREADYTLAPLGGELVLVRYTL